MLYDYYFFKPKPIIMKNFAKLSVIILVVSLLFPSCSKDDSNSDGSSSVNSGVVNKSSISAKWNVNNSSEFTSFEFNQSGTFIIVSNSGVETGAYNITGDNIVLNNYGTMSVDSITSDYLAFNLETNSKSTNSPYQLTANKAVEMTNSSNTSLLCRTWQISDSESDMNGVTVLFSQAGTYFVSFPPDGDSGSYNQLSYWAWTNATEDSFCYNHDQAANCAVDKAVQVSNLTATTLTITEDGEEFILIPVNNSRSLNYNTFLSKDKNPYSWIGK